MSFFSDKTSTGRAHRDRRLANTRGSHSKRRSGTTSESPSRYSSRATPPISSRRSSSIPPTPVTIIEGVKERNTRTRFTDEDMADNKIPTYKTKDARNPLKYVSSPPKISPKNVVDMELHREDDFSFGDSEINSTHSADRGGGHLDSSDEFPKPVDSFSMIGHITTAIHNKSSVRPKNLNLEEKALWDTVQSILTSQKCDFGDTCRVLERKLQESNAQVEKLRTQNETLKNDVSTTILLNSKHQVERFTSSNGCKDLERQLAKIKCKYDAQNTTVENDLDTTILPSSKHQVETFTNLNVSKDLERQLADLQCKYNAEVELSKARQEEHDQAIRAIQRVLADVNDEKEKRIEELRITVDDLTIQKETLEASAESTKRDDNTDITSLRARAQRAFHLEREIEKIKEAQLRIEAERDRLQDEVDQKIAQNSILKQELNNSKDLPISSKEREHFGSSTEALQKELQQKKTSLENAKKLIASLEFANGSMATDMRMKLKSKKEQIDILQREANDRKEFMGNLATELKNLQTYKVESEKTYDRNCESQHLLAEKLETAIGALQSTIVELESSGVRDEDVMDRISVILGNILVMLKNGLEDIESDDNLSILNRNPQIKDTQLDSLQEKLKRKDAQIKSLGISLVSVEREVVLLKLKNESIRQSRDRDETKFKNEIRKLCDECKTNMRVLTKKEQELQVLRDSLEVGDVGYISGDESDEDEEAEIDMIESHKPSSLYDASRAQALATLLVHSGSGVEITGSIDPSEIKQLKDEVKKAKCDGQSAREELKIEKESLANAKMIISSLEKANKTMLEDLRSRLHDSNSAIAGLLDKSLKNEKAADDAKKQLENLKSGKMKIEEDYKNKIANLKQEIAVAIATKAATETDHGSNK